jgi:hypothetical protein
LINGTFLNECDESTDLSPTEHIWISSLKKIISQEVLLSLSCEDFRSFFCAKQERTSSSPSGRHFGHYHTMLEGICNKNDLLPQLIIDIACISISTASPLEQWNNASHVMLEKEKGHHIEN